MKTNCTSLLVAFCLGVTFSSCEEKCNRVAEPALYFTLVDQTTNKPILVNRDTRRVVILYKNRVWRAKDTLRLSGMLDFNNNKYPTAPVVVSTQILQRSVEVDSASYELFLDKKSVGTLRLYPFQKSTECDTWIYTSGVTFNGKYIPPTGPTNEVYLLPVMP